MRGRRKKDEAAAPSGAPAPPFFARFPEGPHDDDGEAKVTERRGRASYTEKQGARKATTAAKTAAAKASKLQTLKCPSDGDEGDAYVPVYIDVADAPKTAKAKAKKDAQVRLTTKAAD